MSEIIFLIDQTQIGHDSIRLARGERGFRDLLMHVRGVFTSRMPLFFRIEQLADHREFRYSSDAYAN